MDRNEINEVMKTIAEYTRIVEEAQAVVEANKDILKMYMKEEQLTELIGDEHKATYKAVTSNRFDSAAFKKAGFTELYNSYTKPSTSMRFTFA
jgi:heme oxygenase